MQFRPVSLAKIPCASCKLVSNSFKLLYRLTSNVEMFCWQHAPRSLLFINFCCLSIQKGPNITAHCKNHDHR